MTKRKLISSGSTFEAVAGYSRAVVDGEWVFVSGTTGYDYKAMRIPNDLLEQTHNAFRNIESALAQAGATLSDIVRVQAYICDQRHYALVAPVFGKYLGDVRPAMTMLVAQLVDPAMKIEIEVTARIQPSKAKPARKAPAKKALSTRAPARRSRHR
jgi:enamine deaminase RidA (YjgF/YER057c/UK114 family)